eukprot:TRINITY_DN57333_c0_g1_i1.p1 TRINITY_DN57333_c0_g1~~TRINITY_DN57333_c0_g1_i1.p1  ORF type:complete len:329 (-),score=56.97 TRINITY_DN57333_c0_g1_i1:43-1029(-)
MWEVDVPKKDNTRCVCCSGVIATSELRFRWCPATKDDKNKTFLHIFCAVKAGATSGYTQVSKTSVRKALGLTGSQRELLNSVLASEKEAARVQLLKAAGMAQMAMKPSGGAPVKATRAREVKPTKVEKGIKRPAAVGPAVRGSPAGSRGPAMKTETREPPAKRARVGSTPRAPVLPLAKQGRNAGGSKKKANFPAKDLALFNAEIAKYENMTNDQLKTLLKNNDQSRSGNKAVLIAKVADGSAFGKLPRCTKCYGGKLKIRLPNDDGELVSLFRKYGGAYGQDKEDEDNVEKAPIEKKRYYCTGYFDDDEKVECDWQADTVKRDEWAA